MRTVTASLQRISRSPGARAATVLLSIFLACSPFVSTHAGSAPGAAESYAILANTYSSDHRYGITVTELDGTASGENAVNSIVDIQTGKLLGAIDSDVASEHMNNDEIAPTLWSADDSALLWLVDGKWGYRTEELIKISKGRMGSQVDVLTLLQAEILKRLKKAVPKEPLIIASGRRAVK
jgi:hypothetical protein